MARILRLYYKFTPNQDNNTYYMYEDDADLFTYALDYHTSIDVDLDNYRITTDRIKIKKSIITAFSIKEVTYVVEMDDVTKQIYRCYFVNNYEELDYYVLHVELDLWGTYIKYATLSNINILRCNRNIGIGIYDRIENTNTTTATSIFEALGGTESAQTGINYLEDSEVAIVFIASCVIAENLVGEYVEQILPFACTLEDIRELYDAPTQARFRAVELATQTISGITSLKTNSWLKNNDVKVLKAYIVPNEVVNYDDFGLTMYSKSEASNATQIEVAVTAIRPNKTKLPFLVDVSNIDINKKYYVGVYDDGLELTHYTEDNYIYFDFITNHDGVQVVVSQGDNMKDLTSHFEVSLIGNAVQQDALQKIAWWGKFLGGVIGSTYNTLSSSSWAGVASKGAQQVGNYLGMLGDRTQASGTIGNSDATIVFDWYRGAGFDEYTNYPFYYTMYESIKDEEEHARLYGASFNVYYATTSDLTSIDNCDLLGSGTFSDTYIMANLRVKGVPKDAKQRIENAFRSGIYLDIIH